MKMIRSILFLVLAFSTPGYGQQQVTTCTILFESNSDGLSAASKSKLDSLAELIRRDGKAGEIGISGFTDPDSDEAYNRSLSHRRTLAVKHYLVAQGVSNRMHLEWKGEELQLNASSTEAEKALNRRVELVYDYSKYNAVFERFKKEYQSYMIDPARDTLLTCEGGLKLYFKRGVLNTTAAGPVNIKVQEFYSKSDFVLAGLGTHGPDNTMLESGGMMNIEAWQSGRAVEVRKGQEVGVIFRGRQNNDSMQLFNGNGQVGNMSWLQAMGTTGTSEVMHHAHSKELMTMKYSVSDTSYVYSHYWEEGPLKITKTSIKGLTSIDTVSDAAALQAYWMLGTTKLGWINCDRFTYSRAPKTDITVGYDNAVSPFVTMVFKNINSIMPASASTGNQVMFKELPEGEAVTIIAIFKPKHKDKVLFAMKQATISSRLYVELHFEELDPDAVKERLKDL